MDIDKLSKALDNEENSKFLNLTSAKIKNMKLEILQELQLTKDEITEIMKKLKDYMYVDEMSELRYGAFIRWIPIKDPDNVYLTPGGILCEIKVTDSGVSLTCKNFAHKHYTITMDECLVFQKLSGEQQDLISAMDYLDK